MLTGDEDTDFEGNRVDINCLNRQMSAAVKARDVRCVLSEDIKVLLIFPPQSTKSNRHILYIYIYYMSFTLGGLGRENLADGPACLLPFSHI